MTKKNGRYVPLGGMAKRDLDLVAGIFPDIAKFAVRDGKVDTWKLRYVLRIASVAGTTGDLDRARIRKAVRDWIGSPSKETLRQVELDLVVDGCDLHEDFKNSGLTARQIIELGEGISLLGAESWQKRLADPASAARIRQFGYKKGADEIYKDVAVESFGLPENARKGRSVRDLIEGAEFAQFGGLDGFLGEEQFWDEYADVERGRMSGQAFMQRWSGGAVPPSREAERKARQARERAEEAKKKKNKPRKKPRRLVIEEPIVVRARTFDRDEVLVWADEAATRPWLIMRFYRDGSSEILVADGDGQLHRCRQDWSPINPKYPKTPVIRIWRDCSRVPSEGGARRTPGIVGVE